MPKFYTGTGDDGTTSLLGVARIRKNDPIVCAIGDIDELNSALGVARFYIHDNQIRPVLKRVQNDLFTIGALLASVGGAKVKVELFFGDERVKWLEGSIEELSTKLPDIKKFVLPGGSEGSVHLHLARSISRRAERSVKSTSEKYKNIDPIVLKYLNRLSSFLFVAALYLNRTEGIEEEHPEY